MNGYVKRLYNMNAPLFYNMDINEIDESIAKLSPIRKKYKKGEYIFEAGRKTTRFGFIIDGSANIESIDGWGRRTIIDNLKRGNVFADTYAFIEDEPMLVSVVAETESDVLLLDIKNAFDSLVGMQMLKNIVIVTAKKNLILSKKIFHTRPRTIRGKLEAYLSDMASMKSSDTFKIPFNRQELADYLCVDRSALSAEISKMRKEGILESNKNSFKILKNEHIKRGRN